MLIAFMLYDALCMVLICYSHYDYFAYYVCMMIFLNDAVISQHPSVQSPISCERSGHKIRNATTVHYRDGDHCIIVCTALKDAMESLQVVGESTMGIVKKAKTDHHVLGIWLRHVGSYSSVQMNGVSFQGNNTGKTFHLNFIGKGHFLHLI